MARRSTPPWTVLVTGVGGGGVGLGIVEALHCIRRPLRIIGTDITPYSVGLFKVDRGYVIPPASHGDFLSSLLRICRKEKVQAVIPGTEAELLELTSNEAAVNATGPVVLANDHAFIAQCLDKWKMFELFTAKGVPTPDCARPEQATAFIRKNGFPFLLKARRGSGSRHVSIVRHRADYDFSSRRLASQGVEFILTEYIGAPDQEYTVGVVCRRDGSVVGSITVHRLLQGLSSQQSVRAGAQMLQTSTGITQGRIINHPAIQRQCEAYARQLGVTGPANFQGRLIRGKFVVFEINPRFSGTTPFRAAVGFNDVELVLREQLAGERCARPRFRAGIVALRTLESFFVTPDMLGRIGGTVRKRP